MTAHIDRELAARPELVSIETAYRAPKEQRPGALQKHQIRELDVPDNPDAEPPCAHTKAAIIVFGKHAGRTLTVCTDNNCPVHNPSEAARITNLPDEKLTQFALRLVLTGHTDTPRENDFDFLAQTAAVFGPPNPKPSKTKATAPAKAKPTIVKPAKVMAKKDTTRKRAA